MDTLIHADIFFFITAIAVVLVTAFLVGVLVLVIRVLVDVRHITRKVREEAELVSQDLAELRSHLRKEGFRFKRFVEFFAGLWRRKRK